MKQVETTREAIINRRSVRKYKTDMIPRDIIERIVGRGLMQQMEEDTRHLLFWQ